MITDYSDLMVPWYDADISEKSIAPIDSGNTEILRASRGLVEAAYQQMLISLCSQLTGYIYAQDHVFFERLVVDVIFSMGYGGRRRDLARNIGGCGDGGIDGVIALEGLGLDVIYLLAKRLKPGSTVPVSAVRDFVGSLDARHATKGLFVTTGQFTQAAQDVANAVSKKIILISGNKLCELMVRYNIGIKVTETLQFKEIDLGYFSGLTAKLGVSSSNSASIHPRK